MNRARVQNSYFLPATCSVLDRVVFLQLDLCPDADRGVAVGGVVILLLVDATHAALRVTAFHIGIERFLLALARSWKWFGS